MSYPNNANQYLPGTIQIPSAMQITAISKAAFAVIDFTVEPVTASDTYIEGQLIRLNIPFGYGMQQANGRTVKIVGISGLTVTVDMDSTQYDPFVFVSSGEIPASFSPAGSQNLEFNNTTRLVPFQSLNNQGN